MKKYLLSIAILSLFCLSCQNNAPDLGRAQQYFPTTKLLQKGIVNKYYTHYLPKDKQDIQTSIQYRSIELTPQNTLLIKTYHPSLELQAQSESSIENDQTILLDAESYRFKAWGKDTFRHEIIKPVFLNWKENTTNYEKIIHYPWGTRKWERQQIAMKDTIILKKPAIIFSTKDSYTNYTDQDTTTGYWLNKTIYVQGLGLYGDEGTSENGKSWKELVEQIPMKKFKQMANHGRERIAYIKAEDAMDKGSNFELCGTRNHLFDYYNGVNDIYGYTGGKRVVWQHIRENLQPEKLFDESGYLTFRFIVNCKGEAGRFVTEQSDLDYNRKEFSPATVTHCYDLVKGLKDWDPTHVDKEAVDAIFYFTFKLKDGQLIDILPQF